VASQGQFNKGPWIKEEEEKFQQLIIKYVNEEDREEGDDSLPWDAIAKELETRSLRQVCFDCSSQPNVL
jgi:hypothetical protein